MRSIIFIALFTCSVPAFCKVTEKLEYKYYPVKYNSNQSLPKVIKDASSIKTQGMTALGLTNAKTSIKTTFEQPENGLCKITQAEVQLSIEITLPKFLISEPKLKPQLLQVFQTIRDHEFHHLGIARKYAADLERKVLQLPPMKDCETLKLAYKKIHRSQSALHQQQQQQYDESMHYVWFA